MTTDDPSWSRLTEQKDAKLWRGALLRMPGGPPYEDAVEFMLIEYERGLALLVASGYKAGLLRQVLPKEAVSTADNSVACSWLIENWDTWVAQGNVEDAWVLRQAPVPRLPPD